MRSPSRFRSCRTRWPGLPHEAILDGEIVAWEYPKNLSDTQRVVDAAVSEASEQKAQELGRARPFSVLQQRLGRKKVSDKMLREVPVAFVVFDVLYLDGQLVMDRPLRERARILDELMAAPRKTLNHEGHRGVTEESRSRIAGFRLRSGRCNRGSKYHSSSRVPRGVHR